MDVCDVAVQGVVNRHHTAIGDLLGSLKLGSPDVFGEGGVVTRALAVVFEGRDLHLIEGKVADLEVLAPAGDERVHLLEILRVGIAAVGFALIPDGSLDGEGYEGCDHTVVDAVLAFHADLFGRLVRNPLVYRSATPVGAKQSDGHAGFLLQLGAEEEPATREIQHPCRIFKSGPGAGAIGGWLRGFDVLGDVINAQLRVVLRGGRDFIRLLRAAAQLPLHIGLAGADPDIAHEHVLEHNLIVALDLELLRLRVGGGFGELHHPFAIPVGGHGLAGTGKRNGHLLTRISPTPDRGFDIALDDHVVAEDGRQFDVGIKWGKRRGQQDGEEQGGFFHGKNGFGQKQETHTRVPTCQQESKNGQARLYQGPTAMAYESGPGSTLPFRPGLPWAGEIWAANASGSGAAVAGCAQSGALWPRSRPLHDCRP